MILALEFSSDRRSVALARDGIILSEAVEQTGGPDDARVPAGGKSFGGRKRFAGGD